MRILRIQHSVTTYDGWKRAFDGDPMNRRAAGVSRYEVHRSVTDPHWVMIDLHFDDDAKADTFLNGLQRLWEGPAKALMRDVQVCMAQTVDAQVL